MREIKNKIVDDKIEKKLKAMPSPMAPKNEAPKNEKNELNIPQPGLQID